MSFDRSVKSIKSRVTPPNPALGPTDATGAPTAPRKAAAMAAAGGSAQMLIRQWDNSSKSQRIDLLARFIEKHRYDSSAALEQALGTAALLFFTRIVTWMRLTYQLGYELSVQLSALSLMLQGQRFLSAFAEAGGIEMVTDILRHIRPTEDRTDDKRNALVLLIHLVNSGRVYRELVCDGNGVDYIISSALEEKDPKTLEFFTALFLALGQGNPRKASAVHAGLFALARHGCDEAALCAASVLRALQMAREQAAVAALRAGPTGGGGSVLPAIGATSTGAGAVLGSVPVVGVDNGSPETVQHVLDTLFHLLRSDNVKLRFEGAELLGLVSRSLVLVLPVVDRCLAILDETAPLAITDKTPASSSALPPLLSSSSYAGGAYKKGGSELSSSSTADPLPAASDLKELRMRAQLRRLQLSCGRALCSILLQPAEEARLKLYRYVEAKGGHMSLIKYINLCDSRNDTAIEEACAALRLLAYAPAVAEGYYNVDRFIERSRTAAYLGTVLGKDLLGRVLEGSAMTKEQALTLYKALRVSYGADSGSGSGSGGPSAAMAGADGAPSSRRRRSTLSTVEGGNNSLADSQSDFEDP